MSRLRAMLLWVMGAVALLVGPALFRAWYHGEPFLVRLALLSAAALGGGLVGALGTRVAVRRTLRTPAAHGAALGAAFAVTGSWRNEWPFTTVDAGVLLVSAVLGCQLGFLSLFCWWLITRESPVYLFGVALYRFRRGDRQGAREAIRRYLKCCEKDPEAATRRPIAERFLQDEDATLDVPTELEAAAPPAGTGTELEQAPAPAGRGTELEQALSAEGQAASPPGGTSLPETGARAGRMHGGSA